MGERKEADHLVGHHLTLAPVLSYLPVAGKSLEVLLCRHPAPQGTILLIHEALGSVSYWKSFPEILATATGHDILAYSRAGHGDSEGPVQPRSLEYYREQVETVMPAILRHFSVEVPVLYGHSEGAGIGLLYAALCNPVAAVIAECPIIVPEERTGQTIKALEASYASSDMGQRLGRYHVHPDEVFYSWIHSNRAAFFKEFPFDDYLRKVQCPVLVLQGDHDEFGGILQYQSIHHAIPRAEHAVFAAGHLLHREEPDLVASRVATFLNALPGNTSGRTIP